MYTKTIHCDFITGIYYFLNTVMINKLYILWPMLHFSESSFRVLFTVKLEVEGEMVLLSPRSTSSLSAADLATLLTTDDLDYELGPLLEAAVAATSLKVLLLNRQIVVEDKEEFTEVVREFIFQQLPQDSGMCIFIFSPLIQPII